MATQRGWLTTASTNSQPRKQPLISRLAPLAESPSRADSTASFSSSTRPATTAEASTSSVVPLDVWAPAATSGTSTSDSAAVHPALRLALAGNAPRGWNSRARSSPEPDNAGPTDAEEPPDAPCCCICLEPLRSQREVAVFPCKHRTHAACARRWLRAAVKPTCPTCREEVPVVGEPPPFRQLPMARATTDGWRSWQTAEDGVRRQSGPAALGSGEPAIATWTQRAATASPSGSALVSTPTNSQASHIAAGWAAQSQWMADALSLFDDGPSEDVSSVMAGCRCPRSMAEASVREAQGYGITGDAVASRAALIAAAHLEARGRELLAAMRSVDSNASQLLAIVSDGADLGLRYEWNAAGSHRRNALMLAVQHRQYHLAQRMCEAIAAHAAGPSADFDARDGQGLTALCVAAVEGFPELCALLLAYGADASVSTWNGQTALSLASDEQVRRVLRGTLGGGAPASGSRPGGDLNRSSPRASRAAPRADSSSMSMHLSASLLQSTRRSASRGISHSRGAIGTNTRRPFARSLSWAAN